jgi:hypothetical protein
MEYWEFLIQREGDRGWRTIETGNLQLMEGKYRIVANSDLINTQIQTRVTHQTADPVPQRRSQSRNQTTNPRGLLAILPFTNLPAGIWQFVCSGTSANKVSWQRILKLRVLPSNPKPSPVNVIQQQVERRDRAASFVTTGDESRSKQQSFSANRSSVLPTDEDRFDLPIPTAPIVPISMVGEQENYADGLDRLLEQLERESLKPQPLQPATRQRVMGAIQLHQIFDSPSQLINLNRSIFAGIIPGNRLTIDGSCNLQRLNGKLIKAAKIERLSICLRHPQTSELIVSIEQSLPQHLNTFTFSGDLELPTTAQITFLIGEVSLYDKHNIQLGSHGFTVTLSIDPSQDDQLSFFQRTEERTDITADLLAQLTEELQLESVTIGDRGSLLQQPPRRSMPAPTSQRESSFTHPDIVPVNLASSNQQSPPSIEAPSVDVTGDLEIDFALTSFVHQHESGNYENLEIVVDN